MYIHNYPQHVHKHLCISTHIFAFAFETFCARNYLLHFNKLMRSPVAAVQINSVKALFALLKASKNRWRYTAMMEKSEFSTQNDDNKLMQFLGAL